MKTQLQYFGYTTGYVNIGALAGVAFPVNLSIAADSDFIAEKMLLSVSQGAVIVANWYGTIQIEDSAAGKTFFNQAVPGSDLLGNGGLPYVLSPARLISANSSLTITFTQLQAVATLICLSLHGHKRRWVNE